MGLDQTGLGWGELGSGMSAMSDLAPVHMGSWTQPRPRSDLPPRELPTASATAQVDTFRASSSSRPRLCSLSDSQPLPCTLSTD